MALLKPRVHLLVLTILPLLCAQDVEEAWKNLLLQGRYASDAHEFARAELIFLQAVHEAERFGPDDARVGATLASLGQAYRAEKKYGESEKAYTRALIILQSSHGEDSVEVANLNFDFAGLMADQGRHPSALSSLRKCLLTYEKISGSKSLRIADVLCMQGDSYRAMKMYPEAETPLKRCANIREADGGVEYAPLGDALHSLALVFEKEGKYAMADPAFKLAEKIREKTLGIMSPAFAETLEAHASLLHQMGRDSEAQRDAALAASIRRNEQKGK